MNLRSSIGEETDESVVQNQRCTPITLNHKQKNRFEIQIRWYFS